MNQAEKLLLKVSILDHLEKIDDIEAQISFLKEMIKDLERDWNLVNEEVSHNLI